MTFQTRILAAAGLVSLGLSASPAAYAADITAPAYKAAPVAAYNWSGAYIGGQVGYGWSRFDHSLAELGPGWGDGMHVFLPPYLSPDLRGHGLLGGLTAGFNIQHGHAVWGLEADFSWSGLKASGETDWANPNNLIPEIASFETKVDWFVTLRPRFGWLLNEQTLPYVTGGLAIGRVHASYTLTDLNSLGGIPTPDKSYPSSNADTLVGWSLGGGVEYAMSQQWTLKAEYLHVDFGKMKLRNTVYGDPDDWQDITVRTTLDLVRVGANYRF